MLYIKIIGCTVILICLINHILWQRKWAKEIDAYAKYCDASRKNAHKISNDSPRIAK